MSRKTRTCSRTKLGESQAMRTCPNWTAKQGIFWVFFKGKMAVEDQKLQNFSLAPLALANHHSSDTIQLLYDHFTLRIRLLAIKMYTCHRKEYTGYVRIPTVGLEEDITSLWRSDVYNLVQRDVCHQWHMSCIFISMYMSSLSFFKGPHHIARCTSVVALALEMYVCRWS